MDFMIEIGCPEIRGYLVARYPGHKRREKNVIHYAADKKNFNPENSACNRSSKDGSKTGTDSADNKFFSVSSSKLEPPICAQGPSFPAEPPLASVMIVVKSFTGTTAAFIFALRL